VLYHRHKTEAAYRELDLPACTDCGACCISEQDREWHAELHSEEVLRGPFSPRGRYRRYVTSALSGSALKTKWRPVSTGLLRQAQICACALLRGNPLVQVSCSIYRDRPAVCKAFRRGSKECRDAVWWLISAAQDL
jgi:Fe-S-cluster containining protein